VSVVAGVDFGTLSVRISIFDKNAASSGLPIAEYPLHHSATDPHLKTQSHDDQMAALVRAMREAVQVSGIDGHEIKSIALDTTGSSVIVVGEGLVPLGEYYLWCDHRAAGEAAEITRAAHAFRGGAGFEGIDWCGGVYSSEWGWSKLLHWLRHNPELRPKFVTALEHCDMVAATLCGVTDPNQIPRSICAMGHKWMWNPRWGGLPPEEFLTAVDPLLAGVRDKITGRYNTSDKIAGHLSRKNGRKQLGLTPGIPIPTGAFDAHWDAIGANIRLGDVVNVIGTSTCIIGLSDKQTLVPGVCGVVPGSVDPGRVGIEAGMSAVGDVFAAIAARAGTTVAALSEAGAHLIAPARPACSASPGTTATAPCWSTPRSAASPSAGTCTTPPPTNSSPRSKAPPCTPASSSTAWRRTARPSTASSTAAASPSAMPSSTRSTPTSCASPCSSPRATSPRWAPSSSHSSLPATSSPSKLRRTPSARPSKTFTPEPTEAARYDRLFQLFRDAYFALRARPTPARCARPHPARAARPSAATRDRRRRVEVEQLKTPASAHTERTKSSHPTADTSASGSSTR
jgi:sugar (pentulose or hexulose) kinase